MASLSAALAVIPSLPRPILARLTVRMIDRLDEMDGDPDIEEGNDLELMDEDGSVECYAILPFYGVDQSLGPVNATTAMVAHSRALLGMRPRD